MRVAPSARGLASHLEADGVVILASDGSQLSVVEVWPENAETAARLRFPVGFGVTGLVARNGQATLLSADSPRNPVHRELLGLRDRETVARMVLPTIGVSGAVVGVIAAHRAPSRPFTAADAALGAPLASLVGLELHAEQLWGTAHRHRTERDRLIKAAISAQEAERRRIAFDLHDGVSTTLASMSFHLSAAALSVSELDGPTPRSGAVERVRSEVGAARRLADLAYQHARFAISGLHSLVLDDLGLVAALESLAQNAVVEGGPAVDMVVDPRATFDDIPDHAAAALYRIAQEALGNAIKHSRADRVVLSLRRVEDTVVLGCMDDGIGFDPEERRAARVDDDGAQHFGLSSIAERCALIEASLRLESVLGRGTTVLVALPL